MSCLAVWEAMMILDFVTVTLISNEGSSLAQLSPSDSRAVVNRPVKGIAELANGKENPRDRATLALWFNSDRARKKTYEKIL